MEVPDEGVVQDVPRGDPGPLFRPVTLPVHQVVKSPPTPARVQEATESEGGASIYEVVEVAQQGPEYCLGLV